LGKLFYMQISAPIIETFILFTIVKHMHDTFTTIVSVAMFVRSVIRINTIKNYYYISLFRICELATAIMAKTSFFKISDSMYDNKIKVVSTATFSWSRIMTKIT